MQIPDAMTRPASPLLDAPLDADQRTVADWATEASGVVVGAPGSGKTTTLLARVRELVASGVDPDHLLVLTPTRPAATALRDPLALAVGRATSGALARSVASFAFQLVRGAEVRRGGEPPQLLTGGDEDQIIRDLLEGDALDEVDGVSRWPAWLDPSIRSTRGFRGDLRAFLAECTDLGVTSAELADLAAHLDLPVWASLASFSDEYRAVRASMRGAHRDAADLAREATVVLDDARADRELLGRFASLRCILVDDAQELTPGGIDVLGACRALGIGVVAFGDPDVGSGAFRGATPENFARLARELGTTVALGTPHRGTPEQVDLVRQVASRIGAGRGRGAPSSPGGCSPAGLRAHVPAALARRRGGCHLAAAARAARPGGRPVGFVCGDRPRLAAGGRARGRAGSPRGAGAGEWTGTGARSAAAGPRPRAAGRVGHDRSRRLGRG
ncbi:UvrD-helicase domain-containing protein [Microbacterium proteolyticum]|uniref:UvrD-helicase domain-containing protein n=1 Tax=Microbacterium proteolyticum TaxID=1572644 RepID=UPI0027D84829|nr:UvrD-helicase domain-containing protein [Microbacterium proteolyticum]